MRTLTISTYFDVKPLDQNLVDQTISNVKNDSFFINALNELSTKPLFNFQAIHTPQSFGGQNKPILILDSTDDVIRVRASYDILPSKDDLVAFLLYLAFTPLTELNQQSVAINPKLPSDGGSGTIPNFLPAGLISGLIKSAFSFGLAIYLLPIALSWFSSRKNKN